MRRFPLFAAVALLGTPWSLPAAVEDDAPFFIEGYAAQLSYAPGDEAALHVSTSAAKFSVEVARLGKEREIVWNRKDLPGQVYSVPEDASAQGCHWPEAFRVPIRKGWKSGYYEVLLKVADKGGKWTHRGKRAAESTAFFIVRAAEPGKRTPILIELCTNTYNAYNDWGGSSLYAYNSLAKNQGHRVSFDRPPASQFSRWETFFVAWCENNGYVLDYAANSDLEFRPELLSHYKLVLSVGHDEYWSAPMRDSLEAFIGKGGNVAFFSGNTCCWQVRSEDEGRALVCWKQNYHSDPIYQTREFSTLASLWSHYLIKRPENTLTGVGFLWGGYHKSHGQFMDGTGAFTVHRPDHWALAGTALKRGDLFGAKGSVVGYECDGCEIQWRDGQPFPTHADGTPDNFEILCTGPARWHPDDSEWYEKWEKGRTGNAVMGVYTRCGTVFTCGTTDWAHGLRDGDPAVDKITRNVLEKLGK